MLHGHSLFTGGILCGQNGMATASNSWFHHPCHPFHPIHNPFTLNIISGKIYVVQSVHCEQQQHYFQNLQMYKAITISPEIIIKIKNHIASITTGVWPWLYVMTDDRWVQRNLCLYVAHLCCTQMWVAPCCLPGVATSDRSQRAPVSPTNTNERHNQTWHSKKEKA